MLLVTYPTVGVPRSSINENPTRNHNAINFYVKFQMKFSLFVLS